jgi:hypothetical protein
MMGDIRTIVTSESDQIREGFGEEIFFFENFSFPTEELFILLGDNSKTLEFSDMT